MCTAMPQSLPPQSEVPPSPVPSARDSLPPSTPPSVSGVHTSRQNAVTYTISPSVPPSEDRLPASNPSQSPSISIQSPRQRPSLPRQLKYPAASTSLYSNWSSTSVAQFSPRHSPYRRAQSSRHHSTPVSMHSSQSPLSKTDWHSPIASPGEWYDESLRSSSPHGRSYRSCRKADDSSVEIWPALRRLEGKVDYLTRLLETSSNKFPTWQPPRKMERFVSSKPRGQFPAERRAISEIKMFIPSNAASYVPAERWPQSEMEFIPTSNQPQSMEAADNEISPENQDGSLKKDSLLAIRARASSSMNFAVRLLREFFMPVELKGKNVSGSRGKDQLDPARIQKIKNYVYEFYPTPPSERDCVWRKCRKAIDSYLRKTFR